MQVPGKCLGVLCCALLCFAAAQAQEVDFTGGIRESFKHKPTPDLRLDSRSSFITTRAARIRGIKIGLDFNKTVKVGIGYNWLTSELEQDRFYTAANGERYETPHRLRFAYVSPYMEYTFFKEGRWEASIPVHLGFGSARYTYTDLQGRDLSTERKTIVLYEPYMTCLYKPTRWFGAGVGTGYRLLFAGNRALPENFNSPIYVLKFKLMFGEIVKAVKGQ